MHISLDQVAERETTSGFDARRLITPCRNHMEDDENTRCNSPIIWQSVLKKNGDRVSLPFDFCPVISKKVEDGESEILLLTQVKLVTHDCKFRRAGI